jgi:hypothetical protein
VRWCTRLLATVIIVDMNRYTVLGCAMALACIVSPASSQDLKLPKGTVCWPLHFSGITLGLTTDSEVQRLLGKGAARGNEGDTGGRYFIDEGHTATLHAVSYTDSVVGELTLRAGIDPTIHAGEVKQAESKWFKPADGFGNWHALHLGSSQNDVLKNLGEPKNRIAIDDWRYETICECELPEFFDVFFKDNSVVKVVFSAPAG